MARHRRIPTVIAAALLAAAAGVQPAGAQTYAITPGGAPVQVQVATSGATSRATFTGTAGQRVAVRATGTSILAGKVTLEDGTGTVLRSTGLNVGGAWLDTTTLPADGAYQVVVDPSSTYTGSTTLRMYDVPVDASAAATSGNPATVTTTVPGQNAAVTVQGTAGTKMSLRLTSVSMPVATVAVKFPDGTTLMPAAQYGGAGKWVEPLDLAQTGTYTIRIDPQTFSMGSSTVTVWQFPGDQSANVAAGGAGNPGVPLSLNLPGQNATLHLAGTAGDHVSFTLTSDSIPAAHVSIKNPDGTALLASTGVGTSGYMVEPVTLAQTGDYKIVVNPDTYSTGNVTVRVYTVPADLTPTIAADGSSNQVQFTIPGQNAHVAFAGTAGQRVSLSLSSGVAATTYWINKPGGTLLAARSFGAGDFAGPITLPVDGTYHVVLDPQSYYLGTVTVNLYDVPADDTATATAALPPASGTPGTVTVTTPGQNASVTFDGTAGQRVSLTASSVTIPGSTVWIQKPNGSTLVSGFSVGTGGYYMSPVTLGASGTYRIWVDPWGANTGSMTLQPALVPGDATYPISAGTPATVANANSGQNISATFSGTSGQKVSLVLTNDTIPSANVWITKPDGSTLVSTFSVGTGGGFVDTTALPASGTYTIHVDPQGTSVGSLDLSLSVVPGPVQATGTVGGPTTQLTTTVPGQNAKLTFTGAAGHTLTIKLEPTTCCPTLVTLTAPNGTTKLGPVAFSNSGSVQTSLTLNGSYTLTIDPQGAGFGTLAVTLT